MERVIEHTILLGCPPPKKKNTGERCFTNDNEHNWQEVNITFSQSNEDEKGFG